MELERRLANLTYSMRKGENSKGASRDRWNNLEKEWRDSRYIEYRLEVNWTGLTYLWRKLKDDWPGSDSECKALEGGGIALWVVNELFTAGKSKADVVEDESKGIPIASTVIRVVQSTSRCN